MSEILTAEPVKYLSLWKGEILITRPVPLLTMKAIATDVAERHGLTVEDLRGDERRQGVSRPRQEAMWMMRQVKWADGTNRYSYPRIGRFLGGRDHSTIIAGERRHILRTGAE